MRNSRIINLFVILLRILIGFSFIPSGYKKLSNHRFTSLGTDTQIGFFFEGLYQTGFYWQFLGFVQILTAFLMMTQRFATLGNLFFFGIASNICVITFSMHFSGTVVITSLLLVSSILLLLWDFHKIKFLFYPDDFYIEKQFFKSLKYPKIWRYCGLSVFTGSLLICVCDFNVQFNRWAVAFLSIIILVCTIYSYFEMKKR